MAMVTCIWALLSSFCLSQKFHSLIDTSISLYIPHKMSMFGGGFQAQQSVNPQNIAMAEQELDMVTDLFNRWVVIGILNECASNALSMGVLWACITFRSNYHSANSLFLPLLSIVDSCYSKCISTEYQQNDLSQGESVCIDRCVAKFFDVNAKVGEKMQQMGGQAPQ